VNSGRRGVSISVMREKGVDFTGGAGERAPEEKGPSSPLQGHHRAAGFIPFLELRRGIDRGES